MRSMLLAVVAIGGITVAIGAQQSAPAAIPGVHVTQVRDNIFMVTGAGGNVTVHVGEDGLLLVDAAAASGEQVLAAIRTFSKSPVRQIILTHDHADSAGGVPVLRAAGNAVLGGNFANRAGAAVLAHENAFLRMSASGLPLAAVPTDSFFVGRHDFYFNGEAVEILHVPRAHTDGDNMVFFRRSDVLSTGDVFSTTSYPVIDEAKGGSIGGVIDALNRILEITVPSYLEEGGTLVIPGRGRLSDQGDVNWYRYMVTVIRDRIQDMARRGMTLEQVKAARPTLEYDARFGSNTGPWTTEMFIEAVYRGVSAPQSH